MQMKTESNMKIAERLMLLQDVSGMKKKDIAKTIGVSAQYLSELLRGRRASDTLASLVEHLINNHTNPPKEKPNASAEVLKNEIFSRKIPVVSWASAGLGADYADLCRQMQEQIDSDSRDPNAYAIIIEGDSMQPDFRAGDIVTFNPNSFPRPGDFVVARLEESGEAFFKRYRLTGKEGRIVILESLNPAYAPREFPAKEFRFIHPIWNSTRRYRR
jgi:phage repressor protein C with HTH and peptisase S24 domain